MVDGVRHVNEFTLDCHGVRYAWWEMGSGRVVLFLHGFTGSKANWLDLGTRLADRFRVLAVDLPGHGKSESPQEVKHYIMPEVSRCLVEMLTGMDITTVDLVGYSMGGRLALYFALHYPCHVRSLTLESASPGLDSAQERSARRQADEFLANRIERMGIKAFVDEWERLPLFASQVDLPAEVCQRLRSQRLENCSWGLANSLRGMGAGVQPPLWEKLAGLPMPVILVVGAQDQKFTTVNTRMADMIPKAHLEIVPGVGHAVHLENPFFYEKTLRRFLSGE